MEGSKCMEGRNCIYVEEEEEDEMMLVRIEGEDDTTFAVYMHWYIR